MDKDRLVKLLGMTTSEHDGEALNAMRMANALVQAAGKTWAEVLATQNTINISLQRAQPTANPYAGTATDWSPPHLTDKVIIDTMFRAIYAQPRSHSDFWNWVDDVHAYWTKHQRVTNAQYQGLRRCYNRTLRSA